MDSVSAQGDRFFSKGLRPFGWLALLVFALYGPTLGFGFTYVDDHRLIVENIAFLQHPGGVANILRHDSELFWKGAYSRPLVTASFILDAQIGGASPLPYHLSNVLFHLAACWALFLFLANFGRQRLAALAAAGAYAAHPLLTASVAWIPGRNDSLLAALSLASFLCLQRYLAARKWRDLGLVAVFALAALLTKEAAVGLLPLQAGWVLLTTKDEARRWRALGWVASCWTLVLATWLAIRVAWIGDGTPFDWRLMIAAGFGRWPTMTLAAIGDALVPIHQRILPSYFDLSPVGGLAAVALIAFGLLLSKQRRWGRVAFGAAWLLLFSLAPLFSLVDVALESRLPMPLIGLLLVLLEIDGLDDLGRRPVVAAAVVVAIAALFYASGQYQPSFRDARAVAARALADSPRSAPE